MIWKAAARCRVPGGGCTAAKPVLKSESGLVTVGAPGGHHLGKPLMVLPHEGIEHFVIFGEPFTGFSKEIVVKGRPCKTK